METNSFPFHQHRLKGLNAQAVQGRGTVEKDRMLSDHFFENVPDFRFYSFDHALGIFYIMGDAVIDQAAHDKGLKQFQGHFLGQPALVHL